MIFRIREILLTLSLAAIACLAFGTERASAAVVLNIDGGGILLGASGVDVGGTEYDVVFVEGSCFSEFSDCDALADFDFKNFTDAQAAGNALLDQVFLNSGLGNFDTDPMLTFGCNNFICNINIPYGIHSASSFFNLITQNAQVADGLFGAGLFTSNTYDTGTGLANGLNVFARFAIPSTTVVPLPAAFPLFGTGLGILGFLGWRRRRKAAAV